jgi:crossover junction endodeoxyribonuclease RuvC
MGIDPGVASTGFGIIETSDDEGIRLIDSGVIVTSSSLAHGARLRYIYERVSEKLSEHKPDALAIESLFHSKNLKSLVDVSEAIGVVTLAASYFDIAVTKFTPLKVKSAIVGFGRADKEQVQLMIQRLLGLASPPKPHHVSDALAVAICYRNIGV